MTSTLASSHDYAAITQACGLLDRSERGKLALNGADAKSFLQGQVSNDVEGLTPGTGCYAAFLTPKGKMLGDLRILDTGDDLLLDTERVALQELFNMIRRYCVGYDVELHKRTLESGLLSLIGPAASDLAGAPGLAESEHAHTAALIAGITARAIRTDVGVDLLCDSADNDRLAAALERAGAASVSAETVECLRVEHGRPRYGIDIDESVIPQEAGLNGRAVSFTKGCYVGQETVARLFYRGKPNRQLRGLRCSSPLAGGESLSFQGRTVGRVTSTAVSPRFGPIALALVRREAEPGALVSIVPSGEDQTPGEITATVLELPFR